MISYFNSDYKSIFELLHSLAQIDLRSELISLSIKLVVVLGSALDPASVGDLNYYELEPFTNPMDMNKKVCELPQFTVEAAEVELVSELIEKPFSTK